MEQLKYYEIEFIKSQILKDFEEYRGIDKVKCDGLDLNKPWSEQQYAQEFNGLWTRSIILSEVYDELDLGKTEVKKILKSLEDNGILEWGGDLDGTALFDEDRNCVSIFIREENFTKLQKLKNQFDN